MDDWEVAARVAIDDLTGRYVRCADGGRAADLASLFTEDGVLATDDDELHGRPAIARYVDEAKSSLAAGAGGGQIRHHVSSLRVDFPSRTEALATSYFWRSRPSAPTTGAATGTGWCGRVTSGGSPAGRPRWTAGRPAPGRPSVATPPADPAARSSPYARRPIASRTVVPAGDDRSWTRSHSWFASHRPRPR